MPQEEKILVAIDPEKLNKEVKELCFEWFRKGCKVHNDIVNEKKLSEAFEIMFGETKIKL
jgi:hypothetical protein